MAPPLQLKFKIHRKKNDKEKQFLTCKEKLFFAVHWLTVIFLTSASIFTGETQTSTKTWNMSLYCDEPKFDQVAIPLEQKWPVITLITVTLSIVMLLSMRIIICGATAREFLNILNYFLGFLLCWDITYVLQSYISYPIPSFYQNKSLKDLYCCLTCPSDLPDELIKLDKESRGSFPAFMPCALSYVSMFLFLLATFLDDGERFVAKLLALFAPGCVTVIYSWLLWVTKQNHLEDIFGGVIIGTFIAVYIARDVFSSNHIVMETVADDGHIPVIERPENLTGLRLEELPPAYQNVEER